MTNIEQFTRELMLAHDINYKTALSRAEQFYDMVETNRPKVLNDWISVKDRLPEDGQEVLVYRPHAHLKPAKDKNMKICKYIARDDNFLGSMHEVTQWQPLPDEPLSF
ncbi:MAG: hypothetical protein [Bacteriophage sp.]|nr:MAG: hypothetical protein [Bacteriophage sp.]